MNRVCRSGLVFKASSLDSKSLSKLTFLEGSSRLLLRNVTKVNRGEFLHDRPRGKQL
jgi:hypothetical protein